MRHFHDLDIRAAALYDTLRIHCLLAHEHNGLKLLQSRHQRLKPFIGLAYIVSLCWSYFRTGPDVPRHSIPYHCAATINSCFLVKQEEVLGCLVGVISRDKSASNGLWTGGLQKEQDLRVNATVQGIKVRDFVAWSFCLPHTLHKADQGCNVRLREQRCASCALEFAGECLRGVHWSDLRRLCI